MTIQELHSIIRLGIQNNESLSYRDLSTVEIDAAINICLNTILNNIFGVEKKESFVEESQFETELLKQYKQPTSLDTVFIEKRNNYRLYQATIPQNSIFLISDSSIISHINCFSKEVKTIELNNLYRVQGSIKYNNKWYFNNETFIGTSESSYYGEGKIYLVPTKLVSNVLTKSEFIASRLNTNAFSPNSRMCLSEISQDKLNIYSSNNFVVEKVLIVYIKTPNEVNYNESKGLDLSKNLQIYIANKVVAYLAIVQESNPQKLQILNL